MATVDTKMQQALTSHRLLSGATATGTGDSYTGLSRSGRTYQATVSGTGAVTATVLIQVSNDNVNWMTLGTITLTGTTSATDGFAAQQTWRYTRANVTAISGTGAAVNVDMGV